MSDDIEALMTIVNAMPERVEKPQIEALIVAGQLNPHFFKGVQAIDEIHRLFLSAKRHGDSAESTLRQILVLLVEYEQAVYGVSHFKLSDFGD